MKTKEIMDYLKSDWNKVLAFVFLPTVLVVGYLVYTKLSTKSKSYPVDNSVEGRLKFINDCNAKNTEGYDSDCWKLLQETIKQAKNEKKDIIQLDGKYVLA